MRCQNLRVPGFFEVALLDGCHRMIDNDNFDILGGHNGADLFDFSRTE